jgi:hypothetical protein
MIGAKRSWQGPGFNLTTEKRNEMKRKLFFLKKQKCVQGNTHVVVDHKEQSLGETLASLDLKNEDVISSGLILRFMLTHI